MRSGKVCRKRIGGRRHKRQFNHIRRKKSRRISVRKSKSHGLTRRLWPPGFLRHPPVNSGQKIRELGDADRHNTVGHRGPQKAPALKPLREQACALAVVPNDS